MSGSYASTASFVLWGGAVEVHCYGARHGDWAIKSWDRDEADRQNPGIADRLEALVRRHRIGRLYLPSPSRFDGEVADPDVLKRAWPGETVFRGAYAEGVTLGKVGEACGIASSDCPTIVGRNPRTLLVAAAHAGRESLYDARALFDGEPPRRHASVVHAMVAALGEGLEAFVACGIRNEAFTHPFDDPAHGERNEAMVRHLRETWGPSCASDDRRGVIDLRETIRRQFEASGVGRERVAGDGIDTFSEAWLDGGMKWHSHRRDRSGRRNLVLVIRRA